MTGKIDFNRRQKVAKRKRIIKIGMITVLLLITVGGISKIVSSQSNGKFFTSIKNMIFLGDNSPEKEKPVEDEAEEIPKEEVKVPEVLPTDVSPSSNTSVAGSEDACDAFMVQDANRFLVRGEGEKTVFLTFDDGPSTESTNKILDILKENDVKATFFVWGETLEQSQGQRDSLKRALEEGHAIGNHSYSHRYDFLYPNGEVDYDNFFEDFGKADKLLKEVLGEDFQTRVIRLPGGAMSWKGLDKIKDKLKEDNVAYVDWNVDSGDAASGHHSKEKILASIKEGVEYLQSANINQVTILMHDTNPKVSTVEALPEVIAYLKEQGYQFKTLTTFDEEVPQDAETVNNTIDSEESIKNN
ncbi:polysaccharide deacetylase family protein [Alloiococcus sp. CFN-8]|uniref:polysaccharide deacetylase family protein n=1 Tax=Alloiococcus sp. CFN-8 TaxID=3416081 RepID=UPI003CEEB4E0